MSNTELDPWKEMQEIGNRIFAKDGRLLFQRDDNGEWEEAPDSIKLTLKLDYPDGQTISDEIGEIFTLPPEHTYDEFVVDLANTLREAAAAFEAAHAEAKAEQENQ
jgi:hypothetical protein